MGPLAPIDLPAAADEGISVSRFLLEWHVRCRAQRDAGAIWNAPGLRVQISACSGQRGGVALVCHHGEDLRWQGIELGGGGQRFGTQLMHWYSNLLLRQATVDPLIAGLYFAVIGMILPPRMFMHPGVAARVLWGTARRSTRNASLRTPFGADRGSNSGEFSEFTLPKR